MLGWLFKKFEPEALRFVKTLSEKEQPKIVTGWSLGYCFEITLLFETIKIELTFNCIRHSWNRVDIWSKEAYSHLYWYEADCALNYLCDRYKLGGMVDEAYASYIERKNKEEAATDDIKKRYFSQDFN